LACRYDALSGPTSTLDDCNSEPRIPGRSQLQPAVGVHIECPRVEHPRATAKKAMGSPWQAGSLPQPNLQQAWLPRRVSAPASDAHRRYCPRAQGSSINGVKTGIPPPMVKRALATGPTPAQRGVFMYSNQKHANSASSLRQQTASSTSSLMHPTPTSGHRQQPASKVRLRSAVSTPQLCQQSGAARTAQISGEGKGGGGRTSGLVVRAEWENTESGRSLQNDKVLCAMAPVQACCAPRPSTAGARSDSSHEQQRACAACVTETELRNAPLLGRPCGAGALPTPTTQPVVKVHPRAPPHLAKLLQRQASINAVRATNSQYRVDTSTYRGAPIHYTTRPASAMSLMTSTACSRPICDGYS